MITSAIARSAHLPAVVAECLTTYVCGPRSESFPAEEVATALLANPTTPVDVTLRILARPSVQMDAVHATFTRPGLTAADAVTILGPAPAVSHVRSALANVPDPEGLLAEHAMAVRPTSTNIHRDVLASATVPATARDKAAVQLAAHPRPASTVIDSIGYYIQSRIAADRDAGLNLLRCVHAASTSTAVGYALPSDVTAARGADPGSSWWVGAASTPVRDLAQWAGTNPTRWHQILDTAADPGGELAGVAARTLPYEPGVLVRLTRHPTAHMRVRTEALDSLTDSRHTWAQMDAARAELLEHAPLTWALRHITRNPTVAWYTALAARTDLTADALDVMDELRDLENVSRRLYGRGIRYHALLASWTAFLATHPATSASTRTRSIGLLRLRHNGTGSPSLADALEHLDPADPASVTDAGCALPISVYTVPYLTALPGIRWLTEHALQHLLPEVTTTTAAHALLALGAEMSATATTGDLIHTAATIAT